MNVLVVGGSGFIGTHLSEELRERGHDVTVLSRSPEDEELPDGVRAVAGDVTDYESLEGAFSEHDAVVNLVALPPMLRPDGGEGMHERVHFRGTQNCLRAATEHDVDRFVQQSAYSADPDAATHYLRAKGRADEAVRDTALDWVIFRPSIVFGDGDKFQAFVKRLKRWFAPGLPIYPLPSGGEHSTFQPIWVEDFVPMMAAAVEDDAHVGETYEIGGPEILTLREVTELVFEAEGRPVRIVPLPMALAKVGMRVMGAVGLPLGPDQYRGLRFDNVTDENDIGAFGVAESDLRTFRSYLTRDG